jgi:parvulin-like peptidyl-prolyl isomerase
MLATVVAALVFLFPARGNALPPAADLPKVGGKPVLARINGEPLLLEEFERALAGVHSGVSDNATRSMSKPSVLLQRLINAKLVLQEARNIGLDALPEVQNAQKAFEEDILRGMLYGYHVRNIQTPGKKEVEKRYREAVKEVKVISVLFDKEEDVKRVEAEVKAGGGFERPAKNAIAAGEAKGSVEGQYLKFSSLSPEAAKAVSPMKKGEVTPVIRAGKQFYLLKLEDIRFPKD